MKKKGMIAAVALALVLIMAVGGTLAWLKAETDPVVNTFTFGDINIALTETTENYKIVPGNPIKKDPKVTVLADSEACWLFVKVEESNWPAVENADGTRKVDYAIADDWTELPNVAGVFYREVDATTADASFAVLKDDEVTVSEELTKAEVAGMKAGDAPKLTFTAYAVQKDNIATAADAWGIVNPVNP